ncbi:MAG: ComEA family DNA-binding protein [Bacteroidota bacterium]
MQPKKKHLLKSYFTFTANERRAVLLLAVITLLFFILPHVYPAIVKSEQVTVKEEKTAPTSSVKPSDRSFLTEVEINPDKIESSSNSRLFYFDPNTATIEDWKRLGVKEKTALTIIRYRSKGGRFKSPEDIKKIWGLSSQIADRLIPFVSIQSDLKETGSKISKEKSMLVKPYPVCKIDINKATQEEWEKLKGIGPATATRIIKFRDKLGGFISVEQVGETYGMKDSTFQQIRSNLYGNENDVQKININLSDIEQLSKHPYIRFKTAKAIIAYREQNGLYKAISDLQKIESITPETFQKMEKYLIIE